MRLALPHAAALFAAAALAPAERAAAQAAPEPWHPNGSALPDFSITRDTTRAQGGRASLRVTAADAPDGFAGAMTTVDAAPWAGRRVRLRAALRADSLGADGPGANGGVLWLRADGDAPTPLAFVGTHDRPARGSTGWVAVEVALDVPANTRRLAFGAFSSARGTLHVDDVELAAVAAGPAGAPSQGAPAPRVWTFEAPDALARAVLAARRAVDGPRPLTARGRDNLVAFTRLLGYVRFFHPGAAGARANWDAVAVDGVRAAEDAPTPDRLAAALGRVFAPIAPDVAVFRTGAAAPAFRPAVPAGTDSSTTGVVQWVHLGVELPHTDDRPGIYRSRRVRIPAPGGRVPDSVAVTAAMLGMAEDDLPAVVVPVNDPRRPLVVDLGGGVSAQIPLAAWAARGDVPDSLHAPAPAPAARRSTLRDRATRLTDVATTWAVMQHFYPYFDVVGTRWDAELPRALDGAATAADAHAFLPTLERLVAALHDGHGTVWSEHVPTAISPVRLGRVEGRVVVVAVGDSGAGALRLGDEVVAVDGRPVADAWRDAAERVSAATPQWSDAVVGSYRLLGGAPGTTVTLRVHDPLAPGAPARDVALVRRLGPVPNAPRPATVAEPRAGVLYVDLDRLTDDSLTAVLPRLQAARGLVFDMRGYPRRLNTARLLAMLGDSAMRTAHFEVPVTTRPDRRDVRYVDGAWPLPPAEARLRAPAVFLTGGGAISYAETTMGIVEAYRLGAVVGGPTAGTNGNVNPFDLAGGAHVVWTGMRVRKHDGTPHHGVGVRPTVPVVPTVRGVRAGRDEVLERALDLLDAQHVAPGPR